MLREMGCIEGGERGCGRASWVDLGFGCRKMGREGRGRLMLDGWMDGAFTVFGFRRGRLSEFLCVWWLGNADDRACVPG